MIDPCSGHFQGHGKSRSGEPVSEAVRRPRRRPGHDQTVLPRWWQRTQEDVPGQESGTTVTEIRAVSLHSDHRLTRQNLRPNTNVSGFVFWRFLRTYSLI